MEVLKEEEEDEEKVDVYRALHSYKAKDWEPANVYLDVKGGDLIEVKKSHREKHRRRSTDKLSSWVWGRNQRTGRTGYFPGSYVQFDEVVRVGVKPPAPPPPPRIETMTTTSCEPFTETGTGFDEFDGFATDSAFDLYARVLPIPRPPQHKYSPVSPPPEIPKVEEKPVNKSEQLANNLDVLVRRSFYGNKDGKCLDLSGGGIDKFKERHGVSLQDMLQAVHHHLEEVDSLNLSDNDMAELPEELGLLSSLRGLDVSRNKLKELPESMSKMVKLEVIHVDNNSLVCLPSWMSQLKNLWVVWASNNRLDRWPACIEELPSIQQVHLEDNRILTVPCRLYNSPLLDRIDLGSQQPAKPSPNGDTARKIFLSGNPFQQPPMEVWLAGTEKVRAYLLAIHRSHPIKSLTLRVVLLGDTCSGKTSIMRTLQNGFPTLADEDDRTVIMDEGEWRPEMGHVIKFTDFGGSDLYQIFYPVFLSGNVLTLLAVNLSLSEERIGQTLWGWVQSPHAQAENSRLVIVATHTDMLKQGELKARMEKLKLLLRTQTLKQVQHIDKILKSGQDLPEDRTQQLKREWNYFYKVTYTILPVSCKDLSGFQDLEKLLMMELKSRPIIVPEAWHKTASDALEQLKRRGYLLHKDVIGIYLENHSAKEKMVTFFKSGKTLKQSTKEEISSILALIHFSGMAVYMSECRGFGPMLLSIDHLLKLMKAIFHHNIQGHIRYNDRFQSVIDGKEEFEKLRTIFQQHGILKQPLLLCLWKQFQLPAKLLKFYISVLNQFDIWFEAPDEDQEKNSSSKLRVLKMPWMEQEQTTPPREVQHFWPMAPPPETVALQINMVFPHKMPQMLYERASIRLQHYLPGNAHVRFDWQRGILVNTNHVTLMVTRHLEESSTTLCIRLRAHATQVQAMWRLCLTIMTDVRALLKEVPHVTAEEYMLCGHCLLVKHREPQSLSLSNLQEFCSPNNRFRQCANTEQEIPAGLVCPISTDAKDSHAVDVVRYVKALIDFSENPQTTKMIEQNNNNWK